MQDVQGLQASNKGLINSGLDAPPNILDLYKMLVSQDTGDQHAAAAGEGGSTFTGGVEGAVDELVLVSERLAPARLGLALRGRHGQLRRPRARPARPLGLRKRRTSFNNSTPDQLHTSHGSLPALSISALRALLQPNSDTRPATSGLQAFNMATQDGGLPGEACVERQGLHLKACQLLQLFRLELLLLLLFLLHRLALLRRLALLLALPGRLLIIFKHLCLLQLNLHRLALHAESSGCQHRWISPFLMLTLGKPSKGALGS